MKYKIFEKHISESFLHDSAAVDTDALIASLGIPVAQEPKKKAAWWLLAGLALLSLLLVGLYYVVDGPLNTHVSDVSSKITAAGNNENNNESTMILAESDESTNENTNDLESIKTVEVEKTATEVAKTSAVADTKAEKSVVNASSQQVLSNTINVKEGKIEYISNENSVGSNVVKTESPNIISEQYLTPANVVSSTNVAKGVSEGVAKTVESINTNVADVNRLLDVLSPLDLLLIGVESEDDSPGLEEPECPSFSYRIPWNIALLAEVGVMKPMKDLDNVGMDSSSIFALRDMNESSKEAIQVGLHAKVSKGNNPLYVRGGVAYTRIAEQMNEEYDYIELDTMRGLISITTSTTGDTVTAIYGDIVSETRFTGKSVKHYFLHLLDIPVAVGYELPIGGSFYAGAEIGAQFNIRTSGSGLIFRDINDYADLSEVTTKETKVGISYFGGLHVGKHLSKRSSIQLSARFRYYPSRFSTVDPNIEQRYNLAGLHAGYVFRF